MQLGGRATGAGPLVPLRNTVASVGMCGFDSHQPGLEQNHSNEGKENVFYGFCVKTISVVGGFNFLPKVELKQTQAEP